MKGGLYSNLLYTLKFCCTHLLQLYLNMKTRVIGVFMKTLQSISALFIVLLLTITGNTAPITIAQGSFNLEHMRITTVFEGTPCISASDYSFFCDLNDNGKYYTSGNYRKISSESIINASLNNQELKSLVSLSSDKETYETRIKLEFRRYFYLSNLKQISFEYDWRGVIGLNTENSERAWSAVSSHLYLYNQYGLLGGYVDYVTESVHGGDDKFNQYNKSGVIHHIFTLPFSGYLLIHGSLRQFGGTNVYASVPEPGSIALLLSGITAVFATGALWKKKRYFLK